MPKPSDCLRREGHAPGGPAGQCHDSRPGIHQRRAHREGPWFVVADGEREPTIGRHCPWVYANLPRAGVQEIVAEIEKLPDVPVGVR
jgi:hypothetical protein